MTFDFVMDAFPDYTKFDKTKKVLAVMQILESDTDEEANQDMELRPHTADAAHINDAVVKADDNAFDHQRTYGEEGHFASLNENGVYVNTNFPDPRDEEMAQFYMFKLTVTGAQRVGEIYINGKQLERTIPTGTEPEVYNVMANSKVEIARVAVTSVEYYDDETSEAQRVTVDEKDGKYTFTMPMDDATVTFDN